MFVWAVVENGKPLQKIEVEDPAPTGSEVLIEVTHCGVCHSDLHFWKGEYNMGHGKTMKITDRGVTLPRAPGHEVVGRVVATGPDAKGVSVGDLRIVYPWIGCGDCARCRAGEDNMCTAQKSVGVVRHGGFGSHVLIPHDRYLVDFDGIDPALASTFACSGITVLSAIRKLGDLDPEAAVVLIGGGGLGHAAISMLHALDHHQIVVVDVDAAKRQAALDAGATEVVDGTSDTLVEEIKAAASGTVLYVLDLVNRTSTATAAYQSLAKGGKLVLVGVSGGELELSLATMIFLQQTVLGTNTGTVRDLRDVVALAQSGKLKPIPIECMHWDEANAAISRLKEGRVTGRLVLEH